MVWVKHMSELSQELGTLIESELFHDTEIHDSAYVTFGDINEERGANIEKELAP